MAETNSPKGKKNKNALYIALGLLALGGLIWFLLRRRNVTINIVNYNFTDYQPLTEAQVKAKIDSSNKVIVDLGIDGAIKQFQNEIDTFMADGSPESLAYAQLLEDIIADLESQNKSTTSATPPITESTPINMGMGMAVNMGMGMAPTPNLTTSNFDISKYPLLTTTSIEKTISGTNTLLSQGGLQSTIDYLNNSANQLFSANTPETNQLGLFINDIIRYLGGTPLYAPLKSISVSTNPSPTPSTADATTFVDPVTKPIVTTTPSRTIATCNYFSGGSKRGGSSGFDVSSEGNSIKISLVNASAWRETLLGVFNSIGQDLVPGKKYFIRIDYNVQTATAWSLGSIKLGSTIDTGSQLIPLNGLQNSGVPIIVEGTFTSSNIVLKNGTGLTGETINGNIYITISEFLECVSEPLFVSPVTINSAITTPTTTTPTPTPSTNDLTSFVDPATKPLTTTTTTTSTSTGSVVDVFAPTRPIQASCYYNIFTRTPSSTGMDLGANVGNSANIIVTNASRDRYIGIRLRDSSLRTPIAGQKYFVRVDYNFACPVSVRPGYINFGVNGGSISLNGLLTPGTPIIQEVVFGAPNTVEENQFTLGLPGWSGSILVSGNIYVTVADTLECVTSPLFVSPVATPSTTTATTNVTTPTTSTSTTPVTTTTPIVSTTTTTTGLACSYSSSYLLFAEPSYGFLNKGVTQSGQATLIASGASTGSTITIGIDMASLGISSFINQSVELLIQIKNDKEASPFPFLFRLGGQSPVTLPAGSTGDFRVTANWGDTPNGFITLVLGAKTDSTNLLNSWSGTIIMKVGNSGCVNRLSV